MLNFDTPHRRYNPLAGDWVLVSPHRARRPWLGQVEKIPPEDLPAYDPHCYLCPSNTRDTGEKNPPYASTYVFDNDFPALLPLDSAVRTITAVPSKAGSGQAVPSGQDRDNSIFNAEPVSGLCRVVCFSPRHDLTLAELSQADVEAVVHTWADQTRQLGDVDFIDYVQIFENRGAMMGASNPHPHSQIWSTSYIPNEPAKEIVNLSHYQKEHGSCLLCDYLASEKHSGERLVACNEHFTALIPYWAVWPFELLVISHRHTGSLMNLLEGEVAALADLLRRVNARYDNLFEVSFPYSMGFHQAPTDGKDYPECHMHAHYYPPLLRSATVRKFMVGFEMLAMPQRDVTPETAAERLRSLSEVHYKHRD